MRTRLAAVGMIVAMTGCSGASDPARTPTGSRAGADVGRFRIAVVGDFGSGDAAERRIASMLRARAIDDPFDALITTGDNIYPAGQRSGFDARWQEPYGWVATSGIDVVASLGNHDIATERGAPVMELLGMPRRWYARTIADAQILILDANQPRNQRQRAWLESRLQTSTAAWQIVAFHQPPYSCGEHGNTVAVIDTWVPILEEYGADLVLSGHDHTYQRFAERRGVTYVVTGGGGAGLYDIRRCATGNPRLLVGREAHHALIVTGNARMLRVRAIGRNGSFDEVVLT